MDKIVYRELKFTSEEKISMLYDIIAGFLSKELDDYTRSSEIGSVNDLLSQYVDHYEVEFVDNYLTNYPEMMYYRIHVGKENPKTLGVVISKLNAFKFGVTQLLMYSVTLAKFLESVKPTPVEPEPLDEIESETLIEE